VTIQTQFVRYILPSAAFRYVGEPLDVGLGDAGRLVVGVVGMVRVVSRRLRQIADYLADGEPGRGCRGGDAECTVHIAAHPDEDEPFSGLSEAVVGRDVEVPRQGVIFQRAFQFGHQMASPDLCELRDVFEKEGARVKFACKPEEFAHQFVALIAEVCPPLLLRETLAGRAARKKVKFF